MKSILLTTLLFFLSATAHGEVIAKYNFGIPNNSHPNGHRSAFTEIQVSLDEGGRLLVEKAEHSRGEVNSELTQYELVGYRHLSDRVMVLLKANVEALAIAEIYVEDRLNVCKMAPPVHRNIDHLSVLQSYSEQLVNVLGPQGCWVPQLVRPKGNYLLSLAKTFKKQLEILALDVLGDDI